MTTFKNSFVGASVALIALVSLALPVASVHADDFGDIGVWDSGGYSYSPDTSYSYSPDTSYSYSPDTSYSYSPDTYSTTGGTSGGYSTPSFSGSPGGIASGCSSCGGYSMPSFGSPSFSSPSYASNYPIYTSAANQQYRQQIAPQLPTFVQPNVANTCTAVNSCNTDNSSSYVDNSVYAPDNSYKNTTTVTDNSVYSAPTTVTDNSVYSAPTTVTAPTTISYGPVTTDSHNQQTSYPQPQPYQAPVFQQPVFQQQQQQQYQYQAPVSQPPVYQPAYQQPTYPTYQQPYQPVAYNTTPYITLSQAPYTGLDLGPVGEVLYWAFLVLWCLGAAYLIVVKRVQNKLVSFLGGFLFGNSAHTVAHATHVPQVHAVASVPLVEEGIDPFIKSQIKRA